MINFLIINLQILISSIGRMYRSPLPTLFTVISVGIILSLPACLYLVAVNLRATTDALYETPEITVFLEINVSQLKVQSLQIEISEIDMVNEVEVITADEALEEFKEITGLHTVLNYIQENPLPTVLLVRPVEDSSNVETLETIAASIGRFTGIESVQIDIDWVQRLAAIARLSTITSVLVSVLLILAAVLLLCNATRISVMNRMDEIIVIDQIGGTSKFIRRPFIYTAVFQCLLSILFAFGIIQSVEYILHQPINELASLYNTSLRFTGLQWQVWLIICLVSVTISWIATRITVYVCLSKLNQTNF